MGGGNGGNTGGGDANGTGNGNPKTGKGKAGDSDTKGKGKRVGDSDMDLRFKEDNQMCTNIKGWEVDKAVKEMNGEVPKRTDGRDMCITSRAKGYCSSNCKRRHDHSHSSTDDKATFYQWCTQAFA